MTAMREGFGPVHEAAPCEEANRHLRADAQRNLQAILAAARTVFARRGLDATLDEVAKQAGLGVGTVYRRFRDKGELAEALFEDHLELLVLDAEQAAAIEDPWEAFVEFVGRFLERQATDCGLRDLLSTTAFDHDRFRATRDRLRPLVDGIVRRAKQSGALRADFDSYDIPVIGVMLGAVVDFTRAARPEAWRRYLALLLDGLAAGQRDLGTARAAGTETTSGAAGTGTAPGTEDATGAVARRGSLPVAPLADDELERAMRSWRPHHC